LAQARRLGLVAVRNEATEKLEHGLEYPPPHGDVGHSLVEVPNCLAPTAAQKRPESDVPIRDPLLNCLPLQAFPWVRRSKLDRGCSWRARDRFVVRLRARALRRLADVAHRFRQALLCSLRGGLDALRLVGDRLVGLP